MPLTNTALMRLKPGQQLYTVNDMDGLSIHVSIKGTKIWYFRFSWQGKQARISLGQYPAISLKEAREKRDEMRRLLAKEIDPRTKTRRARARKLAKEGELTFEEFVAQWKVLKYKKLGFTDSRRRNSTQVQIERALQKDLLPILGEMPLTQITRQHILSVLRNIESRGVFCPVIKCRSWLNEIFKHAIIEGHIDINPATDMDVVTLPRPPVTNNPYLTMDELPELLKTLQNYPGTPQIMLSLKLLLLTGVRPGELRFAKPEHFDLENALWRIPAQEVKQLKKKVHRGEKIPDYLVPLPKQAVEIVKELLSMCYSNQKYLLLGRHDPNKPISENTLNHGLHRVGYKDKLTTHGIRATISTALYEMNYKDSWIEAQLSHIDPNKTRRSYNHAQYLKQRRRMMQTWADKLDQWERRI